MEICRHSPLCFRVMHKTYLPKMDTKSCLSSTITPDSYSVVQSEQCVSTCRISSVTYITCNLALVSLYALKEIDWLYYVVAIKLSEQQDVALTYPHLPSTFKHFISIIKPLGKLREMPRNREVFVAVVMIPSSVFLSDMKFKLRFLLHD